MKYRQLSEIERYQIDAGIAFGMNLTQIARRIGRHRSTVMRELHRNGHIRREGYSALFSARESQLRRMKCRPKLKIHGSLKSYIDTRLRWWWSPEQIVGRARLEGIAQIGVETIYRYIYRDKQNGGDLWRNLRHCRPRRKKRFPQHRWPKSLPRPSIEQRPLEANARLKTGHFERDLIVGCQRRGYLLTIVDRKSKRMFLRKIDRASASNVHRATLDSLKKHQVRSLTNDNGCEFLQFEKTTRKLGAPIFFTRPYASWERGTVENTNKLIRQYFPKSTELRGIPNAKINLVEMALNNRPRKSLGYKTPLEFSDDCL